MHHLNHKLFSIIAEAAGEMQCDCYVIGGYVRDLILHRPSKDIDVVIVGSGIQLAESVAKKWGQGTTLSVFKTFGTAQVKKGDLSVEFVGARKESYDFNSRKPMVETGTLEEDQRRRDFTINALAISLNKSDRGELIDLFGGVEDIRNRIIRTPLDPDITFSDDPLRMMRAIRFATQLQFTIEHDTLQAIGRNRERIKIVSAERIMDEFNKIMEASRPSQGLYLLDACGLLAIILPELTALKGVETREGKGHKDNFAHTLLVLDKIAQVSGDLWLRWAALLHDVAKPVTKRWDGDRAGWTFHNHNFIGEKMIPSIFKRLKLPMNEKMRFVQKMVSLHMRPIVLSEEGVTDSAIRRLLFDAGDDIDLLMQLCEADITSKNPVKVKRHLENFALVRQKLQEIEEKDRIRNWQPPIDGTEIMEMFNLPPGREVGLLKNAVKDAILDGIIPNNREAACEFLLAKAEEAGIMTH